MSEVPKRANHAIELLAGLVEQLHYFYGEDRKFKTDVLKDAIEIENILKDLSVNKKETFKRIAKKYEKDINFYVIIQSEEEQALDDFMDKYELDIPTILDKEGAISDICGIYSTPQAVIIDKNSDLFFKGNYNKARFCTRKETRFVDKAIEHLLAGEDLPLYIEYALTQPFGCTLPSDDGHHNEYEVALFNFFN